MKELQAKYGHEEFEILAFPCNQFRLQEPGANGTEIMNCVRWVRPGNNFNPGFQFFHKIQVNGENEHPLYTFMKNSCPPTRDGYRSPITDIYYKPILVNDVRWNFEKFLVDHRGVPIYRFDATTEPADTERFIVEALDSARTSGPSFGGAEYRDHPYGGPRYYGGPSHGGGRYYGGAARYRGGGTYGSHGRSYGRRHGSCL